MTASSPVSTSQQTGAKVPGWVLRLLLFAATWAASIVAMAGAPQTNVPTAVVFFLFIGSVFVAVVPGSIAALIMLVVIAVFRLASTSPGLDVSLLVLTVLFVVIHQLAAICAVIPPRAGCLVAALRPAMVRCAWATIPTVVALGVLIALG